MRCLALAGALTCATVMGCGDSTGPDEDGPAIPSISGLWKFWDGITAQGYAACTTAGAITIAQTGAQFAGTVVAAIGACAYYDGTVVVNAGSLQLTGGQIKGNQVTFTAPSCHYSGTISGSPPLSISGTATCSRSIAGQAVAFGGPWQASR